MRGVLISDQLSGRESLLTQIAIALEAPGSGDTSRFEALIRFLHSTAASGDTTVVLIDEAQDLTDGQFDEVRYLTNLEIPGRKVVEIIMAGQPSLEKRLARPELAPLRQRVAVRSTVEPLSLDQTQNYIEFRLQIAGAARTDLFTIDAVRLVHQCSRGIPRVINVLCDRALVVGFAVDATVVDSGIVQEALADLRLQEPEPTHAERVEAKPEDRVSLADSRLERLEEKVDALLQALARAGYIHPEHVDDPHIRRWLESLDHEELAGSRPHGLYKLVEDEGADRSLPPRRRS
jgi:hypothetical protein